MSDKYRVKFQSTTEPDDCGVDAKEYETAEDAQATCDIRSSVWQGMYTFEVVPPYTPPAITHEGDLTTEAGSPPRADDGELLGLP